MRRPSLLSIAAILLACPLAAQPTWRAGRVVGDALVMSPPGACSSTWYDPEVFFFPDGSPGFLAQGGQDNPCTANVGLDSLFSAKFEPRTRTWQVPAPASCPTVVGRYADFSCPLQEFFAPYQPLASPAVAKVGARYYMAFSGGNADLRKGSLFWAYSDDGAHWHPLRGTPKPASFNWKPLIYPKYGDVCKTFGIPQLTLVYDPSTDYGPQGTFYIQLSYNHRSGEHDTFTFRVPYSSTNPFGLGDGLQVCLNSGPRGTPCTWVAHSGAMVFAYDGQPPEGTDPLLSLYRSNMMNFDPGSGSVAWDPSHGYWLRVFTTRFDDQLHWQTATSLASGVWSAPQPVVLTQFHRQLQALHPSYNQSEVYYGGLVWGQIAGRTGMWLFQPANHLGCRDAFTGLGIFIVALNFS
jgi:hypothetical protein